MGILRVSPTEARRMTAEVRRAESRPLGLRGIKPLPPITPQKLDLRVVKVTNDSGVAGDETTNCTFTYTISTLADVVLKTGLTPHRSRHALITYTKAPDNSYGLAARIGGDWVLLVAWKEIENSGDC